MRDCVVPLIRSEAAEFELYHGGGQPWSTEIWLAQSLLLLMWRDEEGVFQGVPIHVIDSIGEGFSTDELISRQKKTVMCCMSAQNDEFGETTRQRGREAERAPIVGLGCWLLNLLMCSPLMIACRCVELVSKQSRLFSVILSDGRTLDFEASSAAVRAEWVERLRGLIAATSSFVRYHMDTAQYKLHELIKKEKERLSLDNIKKLTLNQKVTAHAAERGGRKQAPWPADTTPIQCCSS